jgi:hypothetical protein
MRKLFLFAAAGLLGLVLASPARAGGDFGRYGRDRGHYHYHSGHFDRHRNHYHYHPGHFDYHRGSNFPRSGGYYRDRDYYPGRGNFTPGYRGYTRPHRHDH